MTNPQPDQSPFDAGGMYRSDPAPGVEPKYPRRWTCDTLPAGDIIEQAAEGGLFIRRIDGAPTRFAACLCERCVETFDHHALAETNDPPFLPGDHVRNKRTGEVREVAAVGYSVANAGSSSATPMLFFGGRKEAWPVTDCELAPVVDEPKPQPFDARGLPAGFKWRFLP
jgi:hypothetical protein